MTFQSNLSIRIVRQIFAMGRQQRIEFRGDIALIELEIEHEPGQESLGLFTRDFLKDFRTACTTEPCCPRPLIGAGRGCLRNGWRCASGHRRRVPTAAGQYHARADQKEQQNLSSHLRNPFIYIQSSMLQQLTKLDLRLDPRER